MNCSFNIRYKPKTTRAFTKSDLIVYDSAGNTALNALTVYGKSEVVDGAIVSAGEGWATVDLGTLTWYYERSTITFYTVDIPNIINKPPTNDDVANIICSKYPKYSYNYIYNSLGDLGICVTTAGTIRIKDLQYGSDTTAFKNSLSGVILAYQLADPTQGNTIAVKTDNGTGINGTMATFTTGTPLRGIPDTTVRDVMAWDGSAGTVTKNCGEVDLGTLTWHYLSNATFFYANGSSLGIKIVPRTSAFNGICANYVPIAYNRNVGKDKIIFTDGTDICIRDTNYTDETAFTTAMSGVLLCYELATTTTEQLTTAENNSIAALRTFTPQTHAQNNAGTEMTVNYTIRVPTI